VNIGTVYKTETTCSRSPVLKLFRFTVE